MKTDKEKLFQLIDRLENEKDKTLVRDLHNAYEYYFGKYYDLLGLYRKELKR